VPRSAGADRSSCHGKDGGRRRELGRRARRPRTADEGEVSRDGMGGGGGGGGNRGCRKRGWASLTQGDEAMGGG
jgi:hypothetical protein